MILDALIFLALLFVAPAIVAWTVHKLARKFHSWMTYDLEKGYYR